MLVAGLTTLCDPLQSSHTLDDEIGGQVRAGLHLTDMLEDRRTGHPLAPSRATHLATHLATHMATRAVHRLAPQST